MTKFERIIEQIRGCQAKKIVKISLNNNQIGAEGAIALSCALKEADLTHLEYISLNNNQIGTEGAIALSCALKEADLTHLEYISLNNNQIGTEGAIALSCALKEAGLTHLEYISLDNNQIGAEGAIALSCALKEAGLTHLESISLYNNQIGAEGAKAIATVLKEADLTHLEYISLNNNHIGDKGAEAIATALKEANLPHLRTISLYNNQIGDEGTEAIATALKKANLPHLKFIFLCNNHIGDKGAEAIATALKKANLPHLVWISLYDNQIGDEGEREFNKVSIYYANSKKEYLTDAEKRAKQKYQLYWDSITCKIQPILIDIEYAKLLLDQGKFNVAIDLYGAALHSFRYHSEPIPGFLDIKQIVNHAIKDMLFAINKINDNLEELNLPIFVLECFEHLNAIIFEKYELNQFLSLDTIDTTIWEPKLAKFIFDMIPSEGQPTFFSEISKLTTEGSNSDNNSSTTNVLGGQYDHPSA